jgi:hypothetical protein
MLTREELKEIMKYDPKTGVFIRTVRTSNRIKVGDVAGGYDVSTGYWTISVGN